MLEYMRTLWQEVSTKENAHNILTEIGMYNTQSLDIVLPPTFRDLCYDESWIYNSNCLTYTECLSLQKILNRMAYDPKELLTPLSELVLPENKRS